MTNAAETEKNRFPLQEMTIAIADRDWLIRYSHLIFSRLDETDYCERIGLPYGLALWSASLALAQDLGSRKGDLAGKTVLELGAGAGVPGMVAAHCGARVCQTDNFEAALWLSRLNAAANGIENIEFGLIDWNDFADERRFDYIVGSDILYYASVHDSLLRIFRTALAPGGRIVLADPLRESSAAFFDRLAALGWDINVDFYEMKDGGQSKRVAILELKPPPAEAVAVE